MLEVVERRKPPRVNVSVPMHYKVLQESFQISGSTLTKNLCANGVKFKSSRFIPLACRLVIEFSFPSLKEPIKAVSRIAWISKAPSGDDYELGNQFMSMTKEDKKALSRIINKALGLPE